MLYIATSLLLIMSPSFGVPSQQGHWEKPKNPAKHLWANKGPFHLLRRHWDQRWSHPPKKRVVRKKLMQKGKCFMCVYCMYVCVYIVYIEICMCVNMYIYIYHSYITLWCKMFNLNKIWMSSGWKKKTFQIPKWISPSQKQPCLIDFNVNFLCLRWDQKVTKMTQGTPMTTRDWTSKG